MYIYPLASTSIDTLLLSDRKQAFGLTGLILVLKTEDC